MSNRGPTGGSAGHRVALAATVVVACLAGGARAQSPALLEAVRVQRPGATAQAQQEWADCARAPRCPQRERLSLLTAVLELSDGDAAAAAQRLRAVKAPRGLEAIHAWYLGEALAWSGRPREAVTVLSRARKAAPRWLLRRIEPRLGELWLDLGDAGRAAPLLEAAAEATPTPEALYHRALARLATGRRAEAETDLRVLYLRFPSHPHAAAAARQLSPGAPLTLTFEEALRRSQAQLAGGDAAASLATLASLTEAPAPAGGRPSSRAAWLALVRGQALLARGKERDAEAQAQLALAAEGPAPVAAEALMTLARRLMRLQAHPGARDAFRRVDEGFPDSALADEAGYLGAWLSMNAGELDVAVADFERFEARHGSSRRRDEARWFRGYAHFRAGRHAAAREVLLTLPADFPKSSLVPQALYWAARAAQVATPLRAPDGGTPVDVAAEYRALTAAFPGSLYARLGIERLRELGLAPPPLFPNPPVHPSPPRPPGLALAAALAETGLFRDAAEEVQRAVAGITAADALLWGHALQDLGEYGAAHALASRWLWSATYAQRQPEALALMYPRAFRESVERWSQAHELDPFFAWAIMRRESGFRPEVTSSADARGLMQIIPPTARAIALETKAPPPDAAELYSPDTNVRMGTWYLARLLDRLHHPSLAAAAYNGGPTAVVRWVQQRGELPLDQWIEEISFRETRGYVKQVTADYFIYQQLYGGAAGRLSLSVPTPRATGVEF